MSAEKRLEMLDLMLAKGSNDPFHWYARAMELRSLGRLDDALAAYDEVTGKFPDYVPTYLMGGQVAIELDQVDKARDFLERGLKAAGKAGDDKALSELGQALDTLA